jgi:Crinkler effector protein N-terminal domain
VIHEKNTQLRLRPPQIYTLIHITTLPLSLSPCLYLTSKVKTIMSNPNLLKKFCWVLGDGPQNVFPVKIASDEDVGTLKKFIKNEKQPTFDHIPTDTLVLYKTTVAYTVFYNELERINLENLDMLLPILELSQAFSYPLANYTSLLYGLLVMGVSVVCAAGSFSLLVRLSLLILRYRGACCRR